MPFCRLVYRESSPNLTQLKERHGRGAYALVAIRWVLKFRQKIEGSSCHLVVNVETDLVACGPSHRGSWFNGSKSEPATNIR